MELQNLEIELRIRALAGEIKPPPGTDDESQEKREAAWRSYVMVIHYKRKMGSSPV
jgi:hypothetical protein